MAKIAGSQESNSLAGERLLNVQADTSDIGDIATPRLEIGFIAVKCPAHRNGLTVITVTISANASNDTRAVLGLPEIKGIVAISLFEIVGVSDCLCPIATLAIGHAQHPGTGRPIPAISQTDARADLREHGLFGHREFHAGRPRF
jgi:hypothetical protein